MNSTRKIDNEQNSLRERLDCIMRRVSTSRELLDLVERDIRDMMLDPVEPAIDEIVSEPVQALA